MNNFFKYFFPDQKRILSLDVIRGIAVLMVILTHNPIFPEYRWKIYNVFVFFNKIGWAGVDLFFVLSGFLVGGLLIKEYQKYGSINPQRFIVRRIFKVWPVYYIFLITYFVVNIFSGRNNFNTLLVKHWPNFLHVQNYFSSTSDLGWLWSLGVEEHFYIALPFVLRIFLKNNINHSLSRMSSFFFTFCLIVLGLRYLTFTFGSEQTNEFSLIFPSHLRFDSLFAGVFLAMLIHFHGQLVIKIKKFSFLLLTIGIILCSVPYYFSNHQLFLYPFGLILLYIGFFLIVLFTHLSSDFNWPVSIKKIFYLPTHFFAFVGLRSYSIYVWHGFFAKPIANKICMLLKIVPESPSIGFFYEVIYWTVPILLGCISFHLIEEPFIKIRNHLFPNRSKIA
ncbi:MAG: acyltransferase [Bacteriovoracaceae bacterium]